MKLDALCFAAHPDDVEISAGGTVAKMVAEGRAVGIVDMTRGELGTRGTAELRDKESAAASKVLGISARENLGMEDGFFAYNRKNQELVIEQIRRFKPTIILCNSISDRHPDHGKASKLVSDSCFLSGLPKVKTSWDGQEQEAWRPNVVYHYIQDYYLKPDILIDVSDHFEKKMEAIRAFSSQFFDPDSSEPKTPISGEEFFDFLKSRAMDYGRPAGFHYAEGFNTERTPAVNSLFDLD